MTDERNPPIESKSTTVTQWGCLDDDGVVRWDSDLRPVLTEAQVRLTAAFGGGKVVKRTQTTTTLTTPWEEVS